MKKFITLLLLICGAASLQAQDLRVGPKLGINNANFSTDNGSPSSIIGIRGGGFVEIGLSEAFFIQPELLYSSKGSKASTQLGTFERTLDYLSVPIIAKYAFVSNKDLQVFGQAGPYVGILINDNLSTGSSVSTGSTSLSTLDIGGQFGVGAAYSVGPGSLTVDVRAGLGFTGIYDNGGSNSTTNQVLPSVTAGYAFAL